MASRALRSKLDAVDLELVEEMDRRQVATADGARSLSDWLAARLDLSRDTTTTLVRTMRRTSDRSDLRDALADGVSFDRVEALSRIPELVGLLEHLDVGGLHREASKRAGVAADGELKSPDDRFLVMQPALERVVVEDLGWARRICRCPGRQGSDREGRPTTGPARRTSGHSSWRKATALFELCVTDEPCSRPGDRVRRRRTRHADKWGDRCGPRGRAGGRRRRPPGDPM